MYLEKLAMGRWIPGDGPVLPNGIGGVVIHLLLAESIDALVKAQPATFYALGCGSTMRGLELKNASGRAGLGAGGTPDMGFGVGGGVGLGSSE